LISLERITKEIEKLNYKVEQKSTENLESRIKNLEYWKKYIFSGIIIILIIIGYFLVKKYEGFTLLSQLNEQNVSYWMIFIIGFLASFHCVGMCGGLVVTYTAHNAAKTKSKKKLYPHFQYNLGRLISYTVIGGILGGIGSFFGINPTFNGAVTLIAGLLMVVMGLSLATHFKLFKKIKIKTPDFIARFLYNQKHAKSPKGPLIIGLLNGFMPCGPLQAMQLFALTSGSVTKGSLSMFLYALGTIPLMFGFGSVLSMIAQDKIQKIIKISGVIVIILGILMINRSMYNFGYKAPEKNTNTEVQTTETNMSKENIQIVNMDVSYRGYELLCLYFSLELCIQNYTLIYLS
jgi:sulfite exporter TauE/SafE